MGAKEGELEGYLLAHRTYSTWEGRAMYIKEVYVIPTARRSGVAMHLCRGLLQVENVFMWMNVDKGVCNEVCVGYVIISIWT